MNMEVFTARDIEKLFYEIMNTIGLDKFNIDHYRQSFEKSCTKVSKETGLDFPTEWRNQLWAEVKIEVFFKYQEKELMFEKFPQNQREDWIDREILNQLYISIHMNSTVYNEKE